MARSCFASVMLLAVFLIGAPFLSVAAAGWAAPAGAAGQRAERSWHQVSAVLLQGAPTPTATGELLGHHQLLARWRAPDGRTRTGRIPVSADMAAGRTIPLWVDSAGSPTSFPLNHRQVLAHEATAAVIATVALGIVLDQALPVTGLAMATGRRGRS